MNRKQHKIAATTYHWKDCVGATTLLHYAVTDVRLGDFFSNFQKQTTISRHINLSDDIYLAAVKLFDSLKVDQPVRLLGISLSNLREGYDTQPSLFEDNRKKEQLTKAMDAINNKLGDFRVTFGSLLDAGEKGSHVIGPAWRPEGVRNVGVE